MRMWNVDPALLCRQHLLGEHVEMHMFVGTILKGVSIQGYIDRGLVDPAYIRQRHDAIVREMQRRGYNHRSPLPSFPRQRRATLRDPVATIADLRQRCVECGSHPNPL